MKFSIIIPTYNRYELLKRSINSVLEQTYTNFELIVIDDSTNNVTCKNIKKNFSDFRIKYIKNNKNSGVNFSRNLWLDNLSSDTDFVVFLDDDDYFDEKCLQKAKEVIEQKANIYWFISNRKWITQIQEYNKEYNYFYDYFIWKKIQWDATHFIKKTLLLNLRFSRIIKQWQEWLFFIELWEKNKLFTYNFDSTLSMYLEWWLSNQRYIKIFFSQLVAIFEFLILRKNSFIFKIKFLYSIFLNMLKKLLKL